MKVPAFTDIGKQAAEVLTGGKRDGIFQYDTKITVNLKNSQGVTGTMKAIRKPGSDVLGTDFKLAYAEKGLTVETQPALKKATASFSQVVSDGLKLTLGASMPEPSKNVKMTVEYAQPYVTSKASMMLASNPIFNVAGVTGYNGWVLGAAAILDVRASKVNSWEAAASYMGPDFVVTAHTTPGLKTVRGTYWQQLDTASSVAAEVKHAPTDNKMDLSMGYCHTSLDGTLHKVKFSNDGSVHLLREMLLRPDTTAGFSLCINALNLSAEPKVGFAIDHSP